MCIQGCPMERILTEKLDKLLDAEMVCSQMLLTLLNNELENT
jgi:hypothetical protein